MKNKNIIIALGTLSLLMSLLYVVTDFNLFLFFFIISSICFINARKMIFKIFAKPIIKRIKKLEKKKEKLVKQIETLEKAQEQINVEEINKCKTIINNLIIKEKELRKQIIVLEAKKEQIEAITNQEKIIGKAIKGEERTFEILSQKNTTLEEQKKRLKEEIRELTDKINPIRRKIDFANKTTMPYIDNLAGYEFEEFIASLLNNLGYEAKVTQESGDYGIDVVAIKDNIRYAIQCKNYSQPVGNKAIQEAYSGKNYYDCHVAIVVTNNHFTTNAINQAKMNKVVLWDRNKLEELIKALA